MNFSSCLSRIQFRSYLMPNIITNHAIKAAYSTTFGKIFTTPSWTINQSLQRTTPSTSIIGTDALYVPCRFRARGNTYQPHTVKRKRKFGLHARLKKKGGLAILLRRIIKGRTILTH